MSQDATDVWLEVEQTFTASTIRKLVSTGPLDKIAFRGGPPLTYSKALGFRSAISIRWLWLWLDVTRSALNEIVRVPGLKAIDLLAITGSRPLRGWDNATDLETFRCPDGISAEDLVEVLHSPRLSQLQSHGANLNEAVVEAILRAPNLTGLDFECTNLDDVMLERLSHSTTLLSLDAGATRMTRAGLEKIARMTQLESLDIWSTRICADDLDVLQALPNLQSLTLGSSCNDAQALHANAIIPKLRAMKSLRKLWLDGVQYEDEHEVEIRTLFPEVRMQRPYPDFPG